MRILRWFGSATVRQATELRRQVRNLVRAQRDLLPPADLQAIEEGTARLTRQIHSGDREALKKEMAALDALAGERLVRRPNPGVADNVEQIFVAAAAILAITTFFIQLFKIPTGSMQPTLYGITTQRLNPSGEFTIPGRAQRLFDYWVHGISYFEEKAEREGEIEEIKPPKTIFPFVKVQKFFQGGRWFSIWFPPENLAKILAAQTGHVFKPGEPILKVKVTSGDHLLVDRCSFNFRRLRRGDIVVFKTRTIPELPQDQLYIKRLVGLPAETLRIGDDHHLIVDGRRLDAATPHFENVYTFDGPPRDSHYSGHLNERIARQYGLAHLAPLFSDEQTAFTIRPDRMMAMGDNTVNSLDSRTWGDFPRENLIGKFFFVYWPISPRFGWAPR